MNRTRHVLAVVGLVLALLFAPVASGPVGAATTATPANETETAGAATTAQQQEASTNSTVSLVETNVTDGSSFEYELGAYDRIENFSVELTGSVTREDDVDSGTVTSDGEALPVSIAGTMEPTGPAGGEPELTLTAETRTVSSEFGGGDETVGLYGRWDSEIRITQPPSTIGSVRTYHSTSGGSGAVVDVYIVEEGPDRTYGEGTLVREGWEVPNREGWQTIDIDEYATNSSTITVEFVTVEPINSSFETSVDSRQWDSQTRASWSGNLLSKPLPLEVVSAGPRDVSVTADDGTNVSFGSFGTDETSKTQPLDLSTNATELTVNYTGDNTIEWSLAYTERTGSVNPSVSVNGNRLNASRTLADGETVSFTPDPSWVREGTNTVAVDLDESALSDDAPAPAVDLRYTHDVVVEPTPTPSATPSPTPELDDSDDSDGGGGGGGGGAPAPNDDEDDDGDDGDDGDNDDDSDNDAVDVSDEEDDGDDGSSGGGGGGAGSSGGGGSGASLVDDDTTDASAASATATATPTPEAAATATQASTRTPAGTVVTDVSFEPSRISTNVQAVVVVTVRNPQTVSDTHPVELELEGQLVKTQDVTVPAESTASVQFAFEFANPGTYTARVDDETATVTVVEPEEGTPTAASTSTQFPGFTPLTVVLAVCVLSALAWRRRD
ncbi:hypothetical protein C2R22_10150 [Salinigranum rubrum]|uniref:CARDB domain-containing protein n=1 Tax=Salinigranum rubrum TaxID=755307 RepID=A0A2I8VJ50_9EURY|nr:hypothetical protein [Salinigranum rubrum]AUV81963.1 hypothetical protein C2R22_10150 [Salinigranum rubrum]